MRIFRIPKKRKHKSFWRLACVAGALILTGCQENARDGEPEILNIRPENPSEEDARTGKNDISVSSPDAAWNAEADAQVSGDPAEDPVISVTISAAGDVTMGNYVGQDYNMSFNYVYKQVDTEGYFFENVYDVFSQDDMTIVNLEGTLTTSEAAREGQTYCLKGDPSYVNILSYGSVEAVSMANNHRMDFGAQGAADSVAAVEGAGIVYAYDDNVGIYEVKGIRIGIVSLDEIKSGQWYVEKTMQENIEKLKAQNADLILACCHWGIERENYPTGFQQQMAHKCIDWGADLVIGHHPHVLQGVECYQGRYIVYSLGNFCFGGNRNPTDKDCMIVQQTFTFVDGEKQEDAEFRMIPCAVTSDRSRNDYRPTPETGETGQRIIGRVNEYSKSFGVEFDAEGRVIR